MSKGAWCDFNSREHVLKLHDMCPKPKCNCQKQFIFTPKQVQLEGSGFKSKLEKIFKGSARDWNEFLKPAVNVAAPFIGMAVETQSKNLPAGQATANLYQEAESYH